MGFFQNNDWLGRPGPYFYNLEHIIFIIVALALCIVIPLLLRKKSEKTIKIILISLWAFMLALDLTKYIQNWVGHALNGEAFSLTGYDLPLYTCSLILYTFPVAIFSKNDYIKRAATNFMCTILMFSGLINFFLSFVLMDFSLFSFIGLHTMLYHGLMLLIPMIMLITGYYKPRWKDAYLGLIACAVFAIPIYILDACTGLDYMYIYNGLTMLPFYAIANAMPHPILWTLIAIVGYVGVSFVMQGIILGIKKLCQLINNKKVKVNTNN